MEVQDKLARRIAALRNESKMTQDDLAEASGLTVEAISRIERAQRAPRLDTLSKLATGLEVSLAEMFHFDEPLQRGRRYRADVRQLADFVADQPRAVVRTVTKIADVVAAEFSRRR